MMHVAALLATDAIACNNDGNDIPSLAVIPSFRHSALQKRNG
jgi:hypothetical protein